MVLTLKPYNPVSKIDDSHPGDVAHPGGSGLINFTVRVLTRYGEVVLDFQQLGDLLSWNDSLSTESIGSWTLKMRATAANEELLRKIHPGMVIEAFCARNSDPLVGVIKDPSTIKRIDTTPELPKFAAAQPASAPVLAQTSAVGSATAPSTNTTSSVPLTGGVQSAFNGGSNSLIARAVGTSEGNRTPSGGYRSSYKGHTDPGNGVPNIGSFSYQVHQGGASTPEQADALWLNRLKGQMPAYTRAAQAAGLDPNDPRLLTNFTDLYTQSPAAATGAGGFLDQMKNIKAGGGSYDAMLQARLNSYKNPSTGRIDAPGFGNSESRLRADQNRRMQALESVTGGGGKPTAPVATAPATGQAASQPIPQPIAPPPEIIGPAIAPIDDPYLDKCPHLLMRGVISSYGRSTDGSTTTLTVSGESYGKIYKDSYVLVDKDAPELASTSQEIRLSTQAPLGVSLIYYQLLKNWVEGFWGSPNGWEARTRVIPFPPNYMTRINNEGSVWSNLQFLAISGFFHIFTDHTGAIVWEKLPWSSRSQALIPGRNWEDLPLLELPSWKIVSWNDRLAEQGIQSFIRCVPTMQGVAAGNSAASYTSVVYNLGSIRQYGGPTKRELQFPIGTSMEQYYTSESLKGLQGTNTAFVDLCGLEAIRWYDRPVQRVGVTARGESAWRIHTRISLAEDWHTPDVKAGEYYVSSRTHNIDISRGSWTTSLDLVRDRRSRYLGIGVGDVKIISAEATDPKGNLDLAAVIKRLDKKPGETAKSKTPKTADLLETANELKALVKAKQKGSVATSTASEGTKASKVDPSDPRVRKLVEGLGQKQKGGTPLSRLLAAAGEVEAGKQVAATKEIELPPEILIPLVPDEYFFFDRFQSKVIAIGNDPIKWAKEKVIPRIGENPVPIKIVPAVAPTGVTPGSPATPGAPAGPAAPFTPVDRIYTAANLFDPTPPLSYDFTLSRGGSGFFGNDQINIPVPSPCSGKVLAAGQAGGYGNRVEVEGSDGITWLLAHMNSLAVTKGQAVVRGQTLGIQGWTGSIRPQGLDGTHLHVEFFKGATKLGYGATRGYMREYFRFVSGGKNPKLNGPSP